MGDGKLEVSFGPFIDVLFIIFLFLGIFAFTALVATILEAEIRVWLDRNKNKIDSEDSSTKLTKEGSNARRH